MASVGPNGKVTSFPKNGEKICAGCEHWQGARELTNNGNAATSFSGQPAMCEIKRAAVYPQQSCTCPSIRFEKWRMIR